MTYTDHLIFKVKGRLLNLVRYLHYHASICGAVPIEVLRRTKEECSALRLAQSWGIPVHTLGLRLTSSGGQITRWQPRSRLGQHAHNLGDGVPVSMPSPRELTPKEPTPKSLTREHAAPIPLPEATLVPASAPAHILASTIASDATPRSNPRRPARDNPLSDPHPRLKSHCGMSMLATILLGTSMLAIVNLRLSILAIIRSQTSEPQNHDETADGKLVGPPNAKAGMLQAAIQGWKPTNAFGQSPKPAHQPLSMELPHKPDDKQDIVLRVNKGISAQVDNPNLSDEHRFNVMHKLKSEAPKLKSEAPHPCSDAEEFWKAGDAIRSLDGRHWTLVPPGTELVPGGWRQLTEQAPAEPYMTIWIVSIDLHHCKAFIRTLKGSATIY
jgi:hypothetical protein